MVIKKIEKKINKMNYKARPEDRKINSVIFGFLSTLGVFVVALAGTFILGYFFTSLRYSAIVTLFLYLIFVLHFSRELKMEKLFRKGYWAGSAFFGIITLVWIIFGGLTW